MRRALAALAAFLLAWSSAGQATHFLLVEHAVCAEHGELVELHPGAVALEAHHPEHAERDPAGQSASQHEQLRSSAEGEGEHDHCQLLARAGREQALPAGGEIELPHPAPVAESTLVRPAMRAPSRFSPLLFAPKTSPPSLRDVC